MKPSAATRSCGCFEHRTATARAVLHLPDKNGGDTPRVDLCVRLGSERYVLEHTRVEPSRRPSGLASSSRALSARSSNACPESYWALRSISFCSRRTRTVGLPRRDFEAARSGLVDWVLAHAQPLYERAVEASALTSRSSRFDPSAAATPAGLPYPVTLVCRLHSLGSGPSSGSLSCARVVSNGEQLEAQRVERLRKALADKCPKLHHCKARGARTVLVLESNDIALTHSGLVSEALARAAAGYVHLPDEIYLVENRLRPVGCLPHEFCRPGLFPCRRACIARVRAGVPS